MPAAAGQSVCGNGNSRNQGTNPSSSSPDQAAAHMPLQLPISTRRPENIPGEMLSLLQVQHPSLHLITPGSPGKHLLLLQAAPAGFQLGFMQVQGSKQTRLGLRKLNCQPPQRDLYLCVALDNMSFSRLSVPVDIPICQWSPQEE